MNLEQINQAIASLPENEKELVSDGYHTFKQLYEHRVALFVALCNMMCDRNTYWNDNIGVLETYSKDEYPWKSMFHYDGTMYDGWFIAGIGHEKGETLTYHLPISEWNKLQNIEIPSSPEWDGHTSDDVVRLLYEI